MSAVDMRRFVVLLGWFSWSLAVSAGTGLPCDAGLPMPPAGAPQPGLHAVRIPSVDRPTVRVAYLIPTNRVAQADGVYKLQTTILAYQAWYRDQMERNGFGPKTFHVEAESDGRTPKVHVVDLAVGDAYLRGDLWGRTVSAASAAGVPVWASRQVWWLIPEAHVLKADGTLEGGTALGAGFGSGDDGGVGMIGSDGLVRMKPELLSDNRGYANLTLPELGAARMVQDVTFPWFEGRTLSSVCSAIVGAGLHELSHAFGLPHNMRNDDNMHGNLMGNGLRGWRGALYPDRYGTDYVRLSYGSALLLNWSRYFNSGTSFTDTGRPTVSVQTATSIQTINGMAHIQFRAADAGGLAAAFLIWKGDLVDEMLLSGNVTTQRFETPYFSTGASTEYKVLVVDRQGNRAETARRIAVTSIGSPAPEPKIKITPTLPAAGQTVVFDATGSRDPDHSAASLQAEWDFDADGVFDAAPSTTRRATRSFEVPGTYLARARLRDPAGGEALSSPIGFRVVDPAEKQQRLGIRVEGDGLRLAWPISPYGHRLQRAESLGTSESWVDEPVPPRIWGLTNVVELPVSGQTRFYRLVR